MLAVPSKTEFCKVPTLYDIPDFFKVHYKLFGMDPSAPIIIGTIHVSLPHILAISNRISEYLSSFSFLLTFRLLSTGHVTSVIKHLFVFFSITTTSGLQRYIYQFTWIQTSHRIFTISFSMALSTLLLFHLSHTFTPCFLLKSQRMFKHTLSCLLLYSFCANILQPLTMCRTFSTCLSHNLHLFETS